MRAGLPAAFIIAAALVWAGCSQPGQDLRQSTGPAVSTAVAEPPAPTSIGLTTPEPADGPPAFGPLTTPGDTVSPEKLSRLPVPLPTVIAREPAATPLPTATPPPTATPVAFLPFPTPAPTSTPQPAATPTTAPPTPAPTPAQPPVPTPTSQPATNPAGARVAASGAPQLIAGYTFSIHPADPVAGRDVSFTLEGLDPWQKVAVEFIDPFGRAAAWITEHETRLPGERGVPAAKKTLYADGSGRIEWLRVGTEDRAGVWTVRIFTDGRTILVTYAMRHVQLPIELVEINGMQLHKYQGLVSDTYYSDLVPSAAALDLQFYMGWVIDQLGRRLGLQSSKVPDVYLSGNQSIFQLLGKSTNTEVGQAEGYYLSGGSRSGIYLRADLLGTGLQSVFAHEYVHHLLDDAIGSKFLPAWLNEGTAEFYEHTLGVEGQRPDAARARLYRSADRAKDAAGSGNLLSLPVLEGLATWNSQTEEDRINLQYSEAYMAVRYLTESYGPRSPVAIMRRMGQGNPLAMAMQEEIGQQYTEFERGLVQWLKTWQDPEREEIRDYTRRLNDVLTALDRIAATRADDLNSEAPVSEQITIKRGLVNDAGRLLDQLEAMSPPKKLLPLHQDGLDLLGKVVVWLNLELEHDLVYDYISHLDSIILSLDPITERRRNDTASGAQPARSVESKQTLVSDAQVLLNQLASVTPPRSQEALHQQGLGFLGAVVKWLNLELEDSRRLAYVLLLNETIGSVDALVQRRAMDIGSGAPLSQRIMARRDLALEAQGLNGKLADAPPPQELEPLREQALTFLDGFVRWLTLEVESMETEHPVKLSTANDMIAGLGAGRNRLVESVNREIRDDAKLDLANQMIPELNSLGGLLADAIDMGYRDEPNLAQANSMIVEIDTRKRLFRDKIYGVEFVYNLQESGP